MPQQPITEEQRAALARLIKLKGATAPRILQTASVDDVKALVDRGLVRRRKRAYAGFFFYEPVA